MWCKVRQFFTVYIMCPKWNQKTAKIMGKLFQAHLGVHPKWRKKKAARPSIQSRLDRLRVIWHKKGRQFPLMVCFHEQDGQKINTFTKPAMPGHPQACTQLNSQFQFNRITQSICIGRWHQSVSAENALRHLYCSFSSPIIQPNQTKLVFRPRIFVLPRQWGRMI